MVADGALTIGVDDDGIGIDPNTGSQAGDGLRNLRERARARGGNVVIADRAVEWHARRVGRAARRGLGLQHPAHAWF